MNFRSPSGIPAGSFFSTLALARAICSLIGTKGAAKSPEPPSEQNEQPPKERVPSRFGQVQPEERDSL